MHLSLRQKLLLAFSSLLGVALVTGVVIVSLSLKNERHVRVMANENVPAIQFANDLERHATRMALSLRDFSKTEDEATLDEGLKHLLEIKKLYSGQSGNYAARSSIDSTLAAVERGEKLIEDRRNLTRELKVQWEILEKSFASLLQNLAAFNTAQQSALNGEIEAFLEGDSLIARLKRIELSSQSLSLANELSATAIRCKSERSTDKLTIAAQRMPALDLTLEKLLKIVDWENDIKSLNQCRDSLTACRQAILLTKEKISERDRIASEQDAFTLNLTSQAEEIANKGLISTDSLSGEVASSMNQSVFVTIGGIALKLIIGVLVAFIFSHKLAKKLLKVSEHLRTGSEQTSQAVSHLNSSSRALAQSASSQAAALEETSASLEEISSMARNNAANAQQAKELSAQARSAADAGSDDMRQMTSAMAEIKEASDNIAKILKTIDEIAFQTNILALNAAVEAARAGESGAGFAVVAEEVRALAQRSANAAKETASKISDSITKSERGVVISGKIAEVLDQIVTKSRKVDDLLSEMATASKEQNQGISEMNKAITEMDKSTQSNAAVAEESAAAAAELSSQATNLQSIVLELEEYISGQKQNTSD